MNLDKKINEIKFFLKNSEEHYGKEIEYILVNPKSKDVYILCADGDEAIEFTPYTKSLPNGYSYVPEYDYNFDYYFLNHLENDLKITYISWNTHNGMWNSINELFPDEINCKMGLKKYIDYCKKNNITKEKIDKFTDSNVPNIMTLFNKQREEER